MNKQDLIQEFATRTNCDKKTAAKNLDTLAEIITEFIGYGEEINWTGFGKFYKRHREERTARNPQTGEQIKIEAHDTIAFKISKKAVREMKGE